MMRSSTFFFFFQAEDGIRDLIVTGVQTCALPISVWSSSRYWGRDRSCMRKSVSLLAFDTLLPGFYTADSSIANGQVAQLVERGPEKAGVGGSIPSLATIFFNNLQVAIKTENSSNVHIT